MKKISLLFAFLAFFATISFAKSSVKKVHTIMPTYIEVQAVPVRAQSCTVSASWPNGSGGTNNVSITTSCTNCTVQQACDAAYALLSILIPG
jgi:hypothetical protein